MKKVRKIAQDTQKSSTIAQTVVFKQSKQLFRVHETLVLLFSQIPAWSAQRSKTKKKGKQTIKITQDGPKIALRWPQDGPR